MVSLQHSRQEWFIFVGIIIICGCGVTRTLYPPKVCVRALLPSCGDPLRCAFSLFFFFFFVLCKLGEQRRFPLQGVNTLQICCSVTRFDLNTRVHNRIIHLSSCSTVRMKHCERSVTFLSLLQLLTFWVCESALGYRTHWYRLNRCVSRFVLADI